MPMSVANHIGFALKRNGIEDFSIHFARYAQEKGILPEHIIIPEVPLHEDDPNGLKVRNGREQVLISHLDSEQLKAQFEKILSDPDLTNEYMNACGQENI
jgi:hypothetical protein